MCLLRYFLPSFCGSFLKWVRTSSIHKYSLLIWPSNAINECIFYACSTIDGSLSEFASILCKQKMKLNVKVNQLSRGTFYLSSLIHTFFKSKPFTNSWLTINLALTSLIFATILDAILQISSKTSSQVCEQCVENTKSMNHQMKNLTIINEFKVKTFNER